MTCNITSLGHGIRFIGLMVKIAENGLPYEIRKIQQSKDMLLLNIPKRFTELLKIRKGDIVKIQLVSDDYDGNSLSLSKIPVTGAGARGD
jgi:hypothetical protein